MTSSASHSLDDAQATSRGTSHAAVVPTPLHLQPPSPWQTPLMSATLNVRSVADAVRRYTEWLDFGLVEEGLLPRDLAQSWGAPAMAGRRYAVLRCASGLESFLRLVEGDGVPGYLPLRSHGWAAMEVCVQDVLSVHDRLRAPGSPFEIIGPPKTNDSLPVIHPMQVQGPDGEIVYLTEIKQGGPGSGLPAAQAPIDHFFIAVLGCADHAASGAWYASRVGVKVSEPISLIYRMLNRAYGYSEDRQHILTTADRDGHLFLELDQYPAEAVERPVAEGQLPPGWAMCSLACPDLDGVPGPWFSPPVVRQGAIYQGRRVGVMRAPGGELLELVERPRVDGNLDQQPRQDSTGRGA